jgi:hypothetical protein
MDSPSFLRYNLFLVWRALHLSLQEHEPEMNRRSGSVFDFAGEALFQMRSLERVRSLGSAHSFFVSDKGAGYGTNCQLSAQA